MNFSIKNHKITILLLFILLSLLLSNCSAQPAVESIPTSTNKPAQPTFTPTNIPATAEPQPTEIVLPTEEYNLFNPMRSRETVLMDNDGNIVHTWTSEYNIGGSVYLLEDGSLLRVAKSQSKHFNVGGVGGRVELISWDNELLWAYDHSSESGRQHHDIEPLPNGNILMIVWELKTSDEAIAIGRDPSLMSEGELWPDCILEIQPNDSEGAEIVWEWHAWDHLVQDHDSSKANYGVVSEHPEKIDINFTNKRAIADWMHTNAVDYNAELDQILLSVHGFNEIWIIDHGTTTAQAAGPAGDLLYRWGNPRAYDQGTQVDQALFGQHDARWIADGYPGAGDILLFNNGRGRAEGDYSSIDQIQTSLNPEGTYTLQPDGTYAPQTLVWTYSASLSTDFYAEKISGAQRLSNGNTLICEGTTGRFFEVTPEGEVVWEYQAGGEVFRVDRYAVGLEGMDM